jgi:hypothetical protein
MSREDILELIPGYSVIDALAERSFVRSARKWSNAHQNVANTSCITVKYRILAVS